uniref:Interleukin 9 n=1 Tax=Oryctolagus cuniculus TaxID=9986 RepID=G1SQV6_RABIT|nr:interleukin-9 [Oryctolagus cuniculus]
MLLAVVLVSSLLFCSVAAQGCLTRAGVRDVDFLIHSLQDDPLSKCDCSTNVTGCLCLPIPSDNCTTPCFQEGLSQAANSKAHAKLSLIFNRVRRTVEALKSKCPLFSCEQPCNQTTAGTTVTFLRTLLEVFQKEARPGMTART